MGCIHRPPPMPMQLVNAICGGIAQLARAPALQAGGQEFESLYLHHNLTDVKVVKT